MLSLNVPEKHTVEITFTTESQTDTIGFTGKAYQIWPNPNTAAHTTTTITLERIFESLNPAEQAALFSFYKSAYALLRRITRENIDIITKDIATAWATFYMTHDIVNKAIELSDTIHVPDDLAEVGDRPQDTDILTYKETDYRNVYTISILGIILTPVWTELLHQYSMAWANVSTQDMQGEREMAVFSILEPTFHDPRIVHAYAKLCNYVQHSIDRQHDALNKTGSSVVPISMFTNNMANTSREKFSDLCFAYMLVRSLIRFPFDFVDDTNRATSNVMKKVHTQILTFVQQRANLHRNEYRAREPQKSIGAADSTQRQNSTCDVATVPLSGMGTQAMMGPALELLLGRASSQYQIDKSTIKEMREFYQEHPFPRTAFNTYVISTGWRHVLPPRVIGDLAHTDYHTLVGITQYIIMTNMNYGNQLIYMMSATQDEVTRDGSKHPWYEAIRLSMSSSHDLRAFREITRFVSHRDSCVDHQIRNILDQVCSANNYYNIPPVFEGLDTGIQNGDLITIDGDFLNQAMRLGVTLVTKELIECPQTPVATITF